MAAHGLLLLLLPCVFGQQVFQTASYVLDVARDSCQTELNGVPQFFDSITMACKPCAENSTFQKTSADGLTCECQQGYRYTRNFGGDRVSCLPCLPNQEVSRDGWECKECADNTINCVCDASRTVTVERELNGLWALHPQKKDECVLCEGNTVPNAQGDRCVRCTDDLKLGSATCPTTCSGDLKAGGYCFPPNTADLLQSTTRLYEIARVAGTDSTQSVYFETHLRAAYTMCFCEIKALGLWDKARHPLEFFDIYLKYEESGQKRLFKVPLLFQDLRDFADKTVNTGDMNDWRITRRMFLVDNQMSISSTTAGTGASSDQVASYVRYVKDITLHITLQDDTKDGKIKIPYFAITYADVSRQDAEAGASVQISFTTTYSMSWTRYRRDFQIAVGTLGTLATLYAGYRTWVWSKRAGRPAIDFPSIINFIFFVAGALSNIFFIITFGIAFYWFIFFKRQDVVYLVHPEGLAVEEWLGLLGAAFALRCLSLLHMVIMQCSVDIFLIDWERPRGITRAQDGKKSAEAPVSIWRSYFVANEWNEIQATRKISPVLQVFSVCFFLLVVGFERTTTKDPDGSVDKEDGTYQAQQSFIYRYALAVTVYIVVAVVQWIFFTFVYERFVEDKVQQLVDLCSMSNISIFIMANANFGYYIHGRSVHGKADTNMQEMALMMKREEEDLCGKRGLVPDTEEQTFIMSLPKKLRLKYEQVYLPAALENAGAMSHMEQGKAGSRLSSGSKEKCIEAYNMINRFLCGFIDHSLKEVDYVVKDKTFLESIMDTEFFDATDKGIFYKDNGHSFDQVLFYGNEMSIIMFDILLFAVVDLIWMNYLLDGVIVFVITSLVCMIRDTAGKKNLARKTLVDERFLI